MYRAASCTCRSLLSRVPVILPKFGSPSWLLGWRKGLEQREIDGACGRPGHRVARLGLERGDVEPPPAYFGPLFGLPS